MVSKDSLEPTIGVLPPVRGQCHEKSFNVEHHAILGCVPRFTDYGRTYTIWPGNRHDAQGIEEFVHGFPNAGIAGKVVMAKNKASWHEPWPEHLQSSFDGGVEVGVEQDEAPPKSRRRQG